MANNPDKEVILISYDNLEEYVHFPDYILEKWKKGQITNTHMTDLLRLELLIKYGGMWLDATVYCSSPNIPDYFLIRSYFLSMSKAWARWACNLYVKLVNKRKDK